ncbi:MAG: GNAT family N-acetyltransferase [Desulfomonile tiedjei]|uniref:GNAT family N-acetyltransferase n=1 Tax=Desulfomonile tiedjei TaxID=2358 RepID=A0A9D6Z4G2_9BACT|nr:GNAT family N-acetyltransferase [Desulfomonile tiedjei]
MNQITRWQEKFASKLVPPAEVARKVKNGDRIYVGSMCSEPKTILAALEQSYVEDVEMLQFIRGTEASRLAAGDWGRFRMKTFCVGGASDESDSMSEYNYIPLYHSQIPAFFRNRRIPIDVAIVQVSEPDRFGRFSLGISVDFSAAAVESARMVIAQVNPLMPRTLGDSFIAGDRIDYLVEATEPLGELPEEPLGETERTISAYVSDLIEDGSILQFGFAGISRGLMDFLKDHRRLGIHTEIFTDPLIDLIESGVVDNSTKNLYRGKSLATSCMGTRRLYDYVHDNPLIELYPADTLLNPAFIAQNDRMVAVNLAMQVDLRGQIRQGTPNWTAFEGSGGDSDFMRGATLSRDGRSIICLRSSSLKSGRSTIVPTFGPKAAVMMNRGEVNYVVTEYGIAYLGGKCIRDRAMAMIEIAHPDHREELMKSARESGYVYPDQVYYRICSPELRRRIRTDRIFKGGIKGHVRVIKSSDETMLRDLFYNLSEESVYFRYFSARRSMPHRNLQQYVNVVEEDGLSMVVTMGPREDRKIIAEARYMITPGDPYPDVAFMVDENYRGHGLASALLRYLEEIGKERGILGFRAEVLLSNRPMIKVFEKLPYVLHRNSMEDMVSLTWRFDEFKSDRKES